MADQPITTSIDSLVKYLKEHGETDTTTLARVLNVNEGTVVDWSDILEKAGMVKIAYKVGKMFLSPIGPGGGAAMSSQVERAVGEVKKEVVEKDILDQEELLNSIRSKLETYSRTVRNAEGVFLQQGGEAKKALDRINTMEKEADKYYNSINAKRENMAKSIDTIDKEIKLLETDAEQIRQFNLDTSGARSVIEDISGKISVFDNNIKQLDSEFSKMIANQRNQLRTMEGSVKVEIDALKEAAGEESKKINEYESALKQYRKRSETEAAIMRRSRIQMLDEAIKTRDEVLGIYSAATSQFNMLNESLKGMKDSWGLLAVFNDRLLKIKADIDECMKEVVALQSQLAGTSRDLRSPKASGQNIPVAEGKVKEIRGKASELGKKKDKVVKDLEDLSK